MSAIIGECYDHPCYLDLAFSDETCREADFIEAACRRYVSFPCRRLLEPGCGGGRLIVELARRGYDLTGFDRNPRAVKFTQARVQRRGLSAAIFAADMRCFRLPQPVDAAFCTLNTFRHLLTEADARQHLECVADALRRGGIYLLGFHLLPPDAADESRERWQVRRRSACVRAALEVRQADRRRRREVLRLTLRVQTPKRCFALRSDLVLRTYSAEQFRRLLAATPQFELVDVFDFWYEIDRPLALSDRLADAVFVLRKKTAVAG
jgi:SAM-dependent methyltransferase